MMVASLPAFAAEEGLPKLPEIEMPSLDGFDMPDTKKEPAKAEKKPESKPVEDAELAGADAVPLTPPAELAELPPLVGEMPPAPEKPKAETPAEEKAEEKAAATTDLSRPVPAHRRSNGGPKPFRTLSATRNVMNASSQIHAIQRLMHTTIAVAPAAPNLSLLHVSISIDPSTSDPQSAVVMRGVDFFTHGEFNPPGE
jgi:hypothetical protein